MLVIISQVNQKNKEIVWIYYIVFYNKKRFRFFVLIKFKIAYLKIKLCFII